MKSYSCAEELLLPGQILSPAQTANFRIGVEGLNLWRHEGITTMADTKNLTVEFVGSQETETGWINHYVTGEKVKFAVDVTYETFKTCSAIRQTVKVTNVGDKADILSHISSAEIEGLGIEGLLPWTAKGKMIYHYCNSIWMGEAQWHHATMEELGMFPTTVHVNKYNYRIASKGSWTTGRYYPMVILENTETGRSFYMELEPNGTWEILLGNSNTGYAKDGNLALEANCADIQHDGWQMRLEPGESYETKPCVYGMVSGGFEEAVSELIAYKRETSLVSFKDGKIPVVYNCYMNSIWSQPSTETLIPLIDACAKAGVEVFCIDAGWFRCYDDPSKNAIGDYNIADDRFPGYGLGGIFDYMKKKGIKPGIWIEAECCQVGNAYNTMGKNSLCRRNGNVLGGERAFFNFREKEVRDYIMALIDKLYALGARFIKNDYNQTTGIGFSNYGGPLGQESADAVDAVLSFFDEVRAKYPDLTVENCGSGGMREDNNTLRHFSLQSTSDQELFYRNTSCASGSLSIMPPEKAGIWAYPYPCLSWMPKEFNNKPFWDGERVKYADGEHTIYNMVNGMIGNMYMSGRIDQCDRYNMALIKESIRFYKTQTKFICGATPVYPMGTFTMGEEGMFCTGLVDKAHKKMLLAVWNINAYKKTAVIDLSKWAGPKASVKICYPAADTRAKVEYHPANRHLSVSLPDVPYSARLLEIKL